MKPRDCCKQIKKPKENGLVQGIIYGIIPHSFCVLFIVLSIFGATFSTAFFKKVFQIPNLFLILMAASFFFAILSALFYLSRLGMLNIHGLKTKWKYLTVMLTVTLSINLLLFYLVIPAISGDGRVKKTKSNAISEDNVQSVYMDQLGSGYKPNQITVKKNIPVKWVINSKSQSCAASIYSKTLGIQRSLKPGENIIEFTPQKTGEIKFSCLMGMYSGKFIVIN